MILYKIMSAKIKNKMKKTQDWIEKLGRQQHREELIKSYPQYRQIIEKLTRT